MIRLSFYLSFLLLLSLGVSWLIEHDGQLTLSWLGYQIEASVTFILAALCAIVSMYTLMLYALYRIKYAFSSAGVMRREKKRNNELQLLFQGFTAFASGDLVKAKKLLKHHAVQQLPIAGLLQSNIAASEGDHSAAADYLSSMLAYEDTELVALRGLVAQAYSQKDFHTALALAEKAHAINPAIKWVLITLADLYKYFERWNMAEEALERALKHKLISPAEGKRQLADVFYLRSKSSGEEESAYYAQLSYKMDHNIRNTLFLAEILVKQGKRWRAVRVLKQGWEQCPHSGLLSLFKACYHEEAPQKKLKKLEAFVSVNPDHVESHIALAEVQMEAGELTRARASLRAALSQKETRQACMLMADLERKSYSDHEKVEEWLRRALAVVETDAGSGDNKVEKEEYLESWEGSPDKPDHILALV